MLGRRDLLGGLGVASALATWPARLDAKALGYPRLLEGPMVGAPRPDGFTIWSRASGAFDVAVEYATDRAFTRPLTTRPVPATGVEDYVTRITITGLPPDTPVWYRMRLDGILDRHAPIPFRTRTAPAAPRPIRIAFGSCARVQLDPVQPVWQAIAALEPDLFLWLGDNIYADSDAAESYTDLYAR